MFTFSSDLTLARSPLSRVLSGAQPTSDEIERLRAALAEPINVAMPTKEVKAMDAMGEGFVSMTVDASGDRPVLLIGFSDAGWDRLAYLWLTGLADAVRATPKKVPKSMRLYANLMHKLTPAPTGDGKSDQARQIVIDKTMENLAPMVRAEVERRVDVWSAARA